VIEIGDEGLTCYLFEDPHEMGLADAQQFSRVFNGDRSVVVSLQELEERGDSLARLLLQAANLSTADVLRIVVDKQDEDHPQVGPD